MKLAVETVGFEELDERLFGVEHRAEHAAPLFDKLASDFYDRERELFATDGNGDWEPLSKPYAAWKARHYPGLPVLVGPTGQLRDSLTSEAGRYSVRQVDDQSLTIGTADPVAHLQRRKGRNPVPFPKSEEAEWVAELHRWVTTGEL